MKHHNPSLAELEALEDQAINWRLGLLEDLFDQDSLVISEYRLGLVCRTLGSTALNITSEIGPVSSKTFGPDREKNPQIFGWGHNVIRDPSLLVRVVAAHEEGSDSRDWIIVNSTEASDSVQQISSQMLDVGSNKEHMAWEVVLNRAIRAGLIELASIKHNAGLIGRHHLFLSKIFAEFNIISHLPVLSTLKDKTANPSSDDHEAP